MIYLVLLLNVAFYPLIKSPKIKQHTSFHGTIESYIPSRRFYCYVFYYFSFFIFCVVRIGLQHDIAFFCVYSSIIIVFAFFYKKYVCEQYRPPIMIAKFRKKFRFLHDTRILSEHIVYTVIFLLSIFTIFLTMIIGFSMFKEFFAFLKFVNLTDFLFGTYWWPDEYEISGGKAFGVLPLFAGTIMISTVAIVFSTPISIMVAVYTAEYASQKMRNKIKFVLETLANIPTVVYGFFAAFILSKWLYGFSKFIGYTSFSAESALISGIVVSIMIMPYMITLIDDAFRSISQEIRNSAISLGAIRHEIVLHILLGIITPNIISVVIISISRAIGETMIVVMAAGLMANMTLSPLEPVTTATVQIVTILTGDIEFNSPKTLAAFAIASVLFCITLILNTVSILISNKFEVKL